MDRSEDKGNAEKSLECGWWTLNFVGYYRLQNILLYLYDSEELIQGRAGTIRAQGRDQVPGNMRKIKIYYSSTVRIMGFPLPKTTTSKARCTNFFTTIKEIKAKRKRDGKERGGTG